MAELRRMWIPLFVTAALCMLALLAITMAGAAILRRLGVDPLELLLWLGLAERAIEPRSQRRRLSDALAGSSVGRSPVPAASGRLDTQPLAGA